MRISPYNRARRAATIIDVVVVIAILGVVTGLAVTVLTRIRERANQTTCRTNLKDLALAVNSYHTMKGKMPPYMSGRKSELYGGWFVHLMPFLGHDSVYDRLKNGQRVKKGSLQLFTDGRFLPGVEGIQYPELICPSDPTEISPRYAATNYLGNWYAFTDEKPGLYRPAQSFSNLSDGLSNVVLFGEGYSDCDGLPRLALFSAGYHNFGVTQEGFPSDDPHYAPKDYTMFQVRPAKCDRWRSQTPHNEMLTARADGTIWAVRPDVSLTVWKQALKPRDDHGISEDW